MLELEPALKIFLPTLDATTLLGQCLARSLVVGDIVLLSGQIGVGKTHIARAIIQARVGQQEEVPSPTFTLVQTYNAPNAEIWHADLYRLVHPDEMFELGLEDAFTTAICLIEWPERMGSLLPTDAISITIQPEAEGRKAIVSAPDRPRLIAELQKALGGSFV